MADDGENGWVRVYHRSGLQVTLPVYDVPFDYAVMMQNVEGILAAGFLATAPGLEAGELKEEIGYVVRRSKDSRDGGQVPVLDLYPASDAAHFACLTVYLNSADDRAAFEAASGMSVAALPEYIGDNKIERGKNSKTDRLVVKAPRPFGVVYVANPKYDEQAAAAARAKGEVYGVPRRKFVRWADGKPVAAKSQAEPQPSPPPATAGEYDQGAVNEWQRWLVTRPGVEEVNLGLPKMARYAKETKQAIWKAIQEYARDSGWVWDGGRVVFTNPAGAF